MGLSCVGLVPSEPLGAPPWNPLGALLGVAMKLFFPPGPLGTSKNFPGSWLGPVNVAPLPPPRGNQCGGRARRCLQGKVERSLFL